MVGELDYRITPINDYEIDCGLSTLDVDLYLDHILGRECLDNIWQVISGDVNQDGELTVIDLANITKVLLMEPIYFPSWTFVPAVTYNNMELPDCMEEDGNDVPEYDPYIDVNDVDEDVTNLDFIGIKMGDANGNCTSCSEQFYGGEELLVRSEAVDVLVKGVGEKEFSLSFNKDITGLEVMMLSIKCSSEPKIIYNTLSNSGQFTTNYRDGIFYIAYYNFFYEGVDFANEMPFLILQGNFGIFATGDAKFQSELISKDLFSRIQLRQVQSLHNSVYPNPASSEIFVEPIFDAFCKNSNFSIFDIFGNLVLSKILMDARVKIDIDLIPGLYYYQIQSFNKSESGKLIIN